ncbi:MAG: CIA30 family protein [Planctomycetes bacterium]|nr:CIA30 family protein [Planctomycetota bacterium]
MPGKTLFAVLCVIGLSFAAGAAELQVASLDTTAGSSHSANATVTTVAGMEGAGGLEISFVSTATEGNPYFWKYVADSSQWQNYDGVKFWVKSGAGTTWGIVELIHDGSYYRLYAGFTITSSWTEVVIPWREFVQRNYTGTTDEVLAAADIQAIGFSIKPSRDKDWQARGPVTFDVDDIRLVDGLSPSPTPVPSAPGLPLTAAKAAATQPFKILCLGDSLTYGAQLPDRTTQAFPVLIEPMFRTGLGYDTITSVNHGIGGEEYWSFAINVQDFIAEEAPDIMLVEFMFNDAYAASGEDFLDTSNIANFRDNVNRSLDIFLRYAGADLAVVVPPPHVIGGVKNTELGPWAAQIEEAATERNLVIVDVYDRFMAKTQVELLTLYAADEVHLSPAGHQEVAEEVYDTLMPYLADAAAPAVSCTHAVIAGTATDAVSGDVLLTVGGTDMGYVNGAWTAPDVVLNAAPASTIIAITAEDASSNVREVTLTIAP